jgi:hypothetical protein
MCIYEYKIKDDDFIVKLTGRYYLDIDSPFMSEIARYNETQYDAILRYGSYANPNAPSKKEGDCITGCIGMRCKYVKEIQNPEDGCVEHKWAEITYKMDDDKICILHRIGITLLIRYDMNVDYNEVHNV